MRLYGVQISEGEHAEFFWFGAAPDQGEAETRAHQEFERVWRRSPERFALVTSGQLQ
jgi:hypothetical protein